MVVVTHLLLAATIGTINLPPQKLSHRASATYLPTAARPSQGGNSINGLIFNESRRPVDRIQVELLDSFDTLIKTGRVSNSGFYSFTGLPSGTYQVRVLTHGTDYVGQTERVEIVNFVRGMGSQSMQVNFTLRSRNARAAISAAGTGAVFVQEVPDSARKVYRQAVEDCQVKDRYDSGLAGLKKAVELFPSYYDALDRLGIEYVKLGQYEPALVVLSKAVEVNPRGYSSLYTLGFTQYNLKQTLAAINSFRRSTASNPNSINAHLWLGIALKRDGRLDQAEASIKRAKELSKVPIPEAHWQLALIYNQSQRHAEAATELEQFLQVQPDSRDAEMIKKLIKQLRHKVQTK